MKNRIRITGPGIYGLPLSDESPTGEYPIGHEFDTDSDLPEGWKGRAELVRGGPAEGSTFVTGAAEPGPLDLSIPKLTEYLATINDADEVQRLLDAEIAGNSRDGAKKVLEARRDELLAA